MSLNEVPKTNEPENKELVARVLQPGNLVWGTVVDDKDRLVSLIEKGIMTPQELGIQGSYGYTPDQICLALLSKEVIPWNYFFAIHQGPKPIIDSYDNLSSTKIAIIVNRLSILQIFPNQILAVGNYFKDFIKDAGEDYGFNPVTNTVFGIPIARFNDGQNRWSDEVVINPLVRCHTELELPIIPVDCWAGLVMFPSLLEKIRTEWQLNPQLRIPVFDPKFKLLDTSL
jgi:hypothetical protein